MQTQFWIKDKTTELYRFALTDNLPHEYAQPERSGGHIAHIRAPARPVGGALHFVRAVIPPRASADGEIK